MRISTPILAAAALLAATPALAQNDTANAVVVDNTAVATDANAMAPVDANAMTAVPPATTETTTADINMVEPAPAPKRGFPWGVLGLLGLIGLIPRTGGRKRG
jgi:hypothetical protein